MFKKNLCILLNAIYTLITNISRVMSSVLALKNKFNRKEFNERTTDRNIGRVERTNKGW